MFSDRELLNLLYFTSVEGEKNPTSHFGDVIDSPIGGPQSYRRFSILTFKSYMCQKKHLKQEANILAKTNL